MKSKFLCGLIMSVSMFSIGAYAADDSGALTTKKYVNDGLEFVYKVASGASDGTVKTLQQQVGTATDGKTPGTGLIGTVETLQNTIGDENSGLIQKVNSLTESSKTYDADNGIKITPGTTDDDPSKIELALPADAADGTRYIYQSDGKGGGTWIRVDVADTWNASFLNEQ